jgi:hypothetical protein
VDEDEEAMEFKLLKYKLMLLIVNDSKKWSVSLPPRDADPESTSIPMDDGINQFVSTCRLLGLTHRDYDGTATKVLKEKIKEMEEAQKKAPDDFDGDSYDLVMKKDGKGLELRAGVWMYRLSVEALTKWGSTSEEELYKVRSLTPNTKEWAAAYVRYQEIISLETLKHLSKHVMSESAEAKNSAENVNAEDFFYRNELCPVKSPAIAALLKG